MDINQIISSGILESYVLGNASPEEIKKVQELEKLYPEIKAEIEGIEEALMGYAEASAENPSVGLKSKIQNQLFSTDYKSVDHNKEAKIIPLTPVTAENQNKLMRFSFAASVALLVVSSIVNFSLYKKLDNAENELAQINAEKSVLADQFNAQQTSLKQKEFELAIFMKPGSKMVSLKGLDISPASAATILWNTLDKTVYINIASLPLPPKGKQYQLWALVDGKPVDAGVFNVGDDIQLVQKMKDMPNAQAFAVTLENAGGSPAPTMEAMYLIGNV